MNSDKEKSTNNMILNILSMGSDSSPSLLAWMANLKNEIIPSVEDGRKIIAGTNVKKMIIPDNYENTSAGKVLYKEELKTEKTKNSLKDAANIKVYNSIWGALHQKSKDAVVEHDMTRFETARDTTNVKQLLELIVEAHSEPNIAQMQEHMTGLATEQSSDAISYAELMTKQTQRVTALVEALEDPEHPGCITKARLLAFIAVISADPVKHSAELSIICSTMNPKNFDLKKITQLISNAENNINNKSKKISNPSALSATATSTTTTERTVCSNPKCGKKIRPNNYGPPHKICFDCYKGSQPTSTASALTASVPTEPLSFAAYQTQMYQQQHQINMYHQQQAERLFQQQYGAAAGGYHNSPPSFTQAYSPNNSNHEAVQSPI